MGRRKKKLHWAVKTAIILVAVLLVVSVAGGSFFLGFSLSRRDIDTSKTFGDYRDTIVRAILEGQAWMDDVGYETLAMTTDDGIPLIGYYIKAVEPSKNIAVLVHGYGMAASTMNQYAEFYRDAGFNVFMADCRAHGASGGKYVGMGWLDRRDYLQWLGVLIAKNGEDSEIVLHGLSMGGAAVMMMGGEDLPPQVKCIVEDCGYTNVFDEAKNEMRSLFHMPVFPLLHIAEAESKFVAGYSFREASALDAVKKSSLPILFIHGDADDLTPVEMARELYAAAECEKELWIVPGAAHALSLETDRDGYIARCLNFCGRYMDI